MQPEDFQPDDLFAQIQGLADRLAAERAAREGAEAADKAKSDLIAMIGQELRTPMEAVIAMADLLLASPLDATQQRYAATLHHSARSLLSVIGDVLDFSRLEAGRFELEPSSFDLHDLVQSLAAVLQARANEKGLTSGVDIGANCPRYIVGDASRVRQVLATLIDNALKFTAEGAVRLYASASEADGTLVVRFDVTDTGSGLARAEQQLLFQPALQVNGVDAGEPAGTGLGLSISRRLAKLMGGEIGCESVVGQGSLYWFTLPAERARLEAPAQVQVSAPPPQPMLSGHVLVVEDNSVNRMLISAYLDEFGLTYDMIDSGSGALMRLEEKSYDLVLMDASMPDLDGIETTKRIRNLQSPAAKVPIVALVANAMKSYCGNYLSAGMDTYVVKPIRGRELYAALAAVLPAGTHGASMTG
jgi:CheY-like chemotaxis protein/nitrogen-specific signal transduction histidine kinase